MGNDLNLSVDALIPKDMAIKAENVGIAKAGLGKYRLFALAILAGAFIAMGANYATTVWAGLAGAGVPYGIQRLLGGLVFATGLVMVIIGGSELFTGDCLIFMAWANHKVSTGSMLRNWIIYMPETSLVPF
jgi:formate transporter